MEKINLFRIAPMSMKHSDFSENFKIVEETNSLKHHGVLGMRWGVRNSRRTGGPGTAYEKSLLKNQKSNNTRNGLESLLITAGISGVIAAGSLVSRGIKDKIGKKHSDALLGDDKLKITKLSEVKRIQPPESFKDSVNGVNKKSVGKEFNNNCPNTTMGYELRRRGYDVKAKPANRGERSSDIKNSYGIKDSDVFSLRKLAVNKPAVSNSMLKEYFGSQPNNSRFAVEIDWRGVRGAGHVFNAEKINGRIMFIDAQSGKSGEFKGLSVVGEFARQVADATLFTKSSSNPANYLNMAANVEIYRIDNAQISDSSIGDRLLKGG